MFARSARLDSFIRSGYFPRSAMLFCTGEYVLFLAAVVAAYWAMPWARGRVYLLLAASLFFYAKWSPWLALLVVGSSVVDYAIGRGLEAWTSRRGRKALLAVSVGMNLGLLGYFKYANFF